MGETTDREHEAKRISGEYGKFGTEIDKDTDFDMFKNYKPQFGLSEFQAGADKVYDKNVSNIGRLTRSNVAESTGRSTQSLASRGITGGSVVDDARSRIEGDVYGKEYGALENLGINRAGQEQGFMEQLNQLDFAGKQGFMQSLAQKYGIKSGALGGQSSMLGAFDDETMFDKGLAIANSASGFIPGSGGVNT